MQIGVRNETHCRSKKLLHRCFSVCCLHTARHQESVAGDQAKEQERGGIKVEEVCGSTHRVVLCGGVPAGGMWMGWGPTTHKTFHMQSVPDRVQWDVDLPPQTPKAGAVQV